MQRDLAQTPPRSQKEMMMQKVLMPKVLPVPILRVTEDISGAVLGAEDRKVASTSPTERKLNSPPMVNVVVSPEVKQHDFARRRLREKSSSNVLMARKLLLLAIKGEQAQYEFIQCTLKDTENIVVLCSLVHFYLNPTKRRFNLVQAERYFDKIIQKSMDITFSTMVTFSSWACGFISFKEALAKLVRQENLTETQRGPPIALFPLQKWLTNWVKRYDFINQATATSGPCSK